MSSEAPLATDTVLSRPQTTFEQLKSWILDGSLSPGQPLPVREVAAGMGTSTMPVRQALARLRDAGLVSQEPHRGAVVSRLTLADLEDHYGLRRLLEPASIRLGVQRMTPERLHRIRATRASLEDAAGRGDLVTTLDLDEELLAQIHDAVGNREVLRVIRATWQRIRPYKLLFTSVAQADAGPLITEENSQLITAAEAADGDSAQRIMLASLDNARLRIGDLLRTGESGERSDRIAQLRGARLTQELIRLREAADAES